MWYQLGAVVYRKTFGVIETTGNIGTSPSLNISRELLAEPIHRNMIVRAFYHITSGGEGKNIGV